MTKLHSWYCTPTTSEGKSFETKLRGSDVPYLLIMEVPIGFVWKNKQINENILKQALEHTLDRFPIAAGRLVGNRLYAKTLKFSNKQSPGALLQFEKVKSKMPEEKEKSAQWSKYFVSSTFRNIREPFGIPLLSARLTHFVDGGCILSVSFVHSMADGASILHFMKTWSYLCGTIGKSETILPNEIPPLPKLDRPLKFEEGDENNNITYDDLLKQIDDNNILLKASHSRILYGGAMYMIHRGMDPVVDFKIRPEDVSKLKQELSSKLEKPKWISSYEAMMSILLRLLLKADGRDEFICRAIVNIRGRSPLAEKEYFGNALSYPIIKVVGKKDQIEDSEAAFSLHESLRSGVENAKVLDLIHLISEKEFVKGDIYNVWERSRFIAPYINSILNGEPIINSWVGFDWFGMDFGLSGKSPDFLRVAVSFKNHRHIHIFPSSLDGELTVRMQLSPSTMDSFKKNVKEANIGLVEVE